MAEEIKVTTIGEPSVDDLPESEQRSFYMTLLIRVLDRYRQQRLQDECGDK